ncbi:MAG: choice-of-anchor J domain-containing protein [Clostridia bacterium]|nr:choice-of-anchor J domain-containing protein [Clostridia bacterium]
MKKIISLMLAVLLVFGALPLSLGTAAESTAPEIRVDAGKPATAESGEPARQVNTEPITIDDDPNGGYEGDYVVIYNPSEVLSDSKSTGNMSGLIQTSVSANMLPGEADEEHAVSDLPYIIDVDQYLAEEAAKLWGDKPIPPDGDGTKATSYNVGDKANFYILNYSPFSSTSVEFVVRAKGAHCYVWTPTSTAADVYPLTSDDAAKAAAAFESKYSLMNSSFGNHRNGGGDGRVNILYYNAKDDWTPGSTSGYIGGYFWSGDYSGYNNLPIIHIDTYPSIYYNNNGVENTYSTLVHEYQHMIHYNYAPNSKSWINESMSAAAEEICYPGSSVFSRIKSYTNFYPQYSIQYQNPPKEYATTHPNLHYGYSMYDWSNDLSDVLALYAQVSLFSQYLYTQSSLGNAVFKAILTELAKGNTFQSACPTVLGMTSSEFVRNFRIAMTANTSQSVLNGKYGWKLQSGYDPSEYDDVENPYNILGPIIFTENSCSIKGGGAITVKPVNGVYNPPAGANSGLQYFGIKLPTPTSLIWDFETDPSTQGFTFIDQDGDGRNWEWKYPTLNDGGFKHHEGLGCIISASYDSSVGALTPDNWMITPEFTGSSLSFWAQAQDPNWAKEYIGIFVSTNGGSTWSTEIAGYELTDADTQYSVNLSAYSDTPIKVAFRHYNSTDQFYANVDYIEISLESDPEVTPQPTLTPEPMLTEAPILTQAPITPGEGIYIEKSVSLDGEDGLYTLTVSVCTTNTLYDASTVVREYLSSSMHLAGNTSWQMYFDPCTGLDDNGVPLFSSQLEQFNRKDDVCSIGSDENGQYFSFTGIDYSDFVCSESGGHRVVFIFHGLAANDDAIGTFSPSNEDISGVYWNNALVASAEPVSVNIRSINAIYDFSTPLQLTTIGIRKFDSLNISYDKSSGAPEPILGLSVTPNGNKLDCAINAASRDVYTAKSLLWLNDYSFEWSSIAVIPATVVMFEENCGSFEDSTMAGSDIGTWSESGSVQSAVQIGGGVFGYDAGYAENSGDSNGSAMSVTVDNDMLADVAAGRATWPIATFNFTGTAVDIISRIGADTGVLVVELVPDGEDWSYIGANSRHVLIDTYFDGGTLYQIPVIRFDGLEHGAYNIRIVAYYSPLFDHQSTEYVGLKGGYQIDEPGLEPGVVYTLVNACEYKHETLPSKAYGSFTSYIDGIRVYNPIDTSVNTEAAAVYATAGELNPEFLNVNEVLTEGNAIYITLNDNSVNPSEYVDLCPKNEVYIRPNGAIAFSIEGDYSAVHISAKSPLGNDVIMSINGKGTIPIGHTSELYYDITSFVENNSVAIEVSGSDASAILSLVCIKLIPAEGGVSPRIVSDASLVEFVEAINFGVMGDADHDGVVTMMDALCTMRAAFNEIELGTYGSMMADVNFDGTIDMIDAILIIRIVLRVI